MPWQPGPDLSCLQLLPSNPHRGPTSSFRCLRRVWEFPKTQPSSLFSPSDKKTYDYRTRFHPWPSVTQLQLRVDYLAMSPSMWWAVGFMTKSADAGGHLEGLSGSPWCPPAPLH